MEEVRRNDCKHCGSTNMYVKRIVGKSKYYNCTVCGNEEYKPAKKKK